MSQFLSRTAKLKFVIGSFEESSQPVMVGKFDATEKLRQQKGADYSIWKFNDLKYAESLGGGPTTKKIMPPGKTLDVLCLFCSFLFFFKTPLKSPSRT